MGFQHMYQLVSKGEFLGEAVINVFFYRHVQELTPSIGIATNLRASWRDQFIPVAQGGPLQSDIFSEDMHWMSHEVTNLSDPTIIAAITYLEDGLDVGDNMPPYVVYPFRTVRKRTDMRRGQKRFSGVPEVVNQGGVIPVSYAASIDALATALGETISWSGDPTDTFTPVIIKRVLDETDPAKPFYRLPQSEAELVYFDADSWESPTTLSTQNTRKYGRGI